MNYFAGVIILSLVAAGLQIYVPLPSFPQIAVAYAVPEDVVAGIASLNFLGIFFAEFISGPLANRFGCRPLMIYGSLLFALGSFGSVFSPSIEILLFFRFVQGLGSGVFFVLSFTMLSDIYKEKRAIKWIGFANGSMTISMAAAPILGGFLNELFGWQAGFIFIALFSVVITAFFILFLPESRPNHKISLKQSLNDYVQLLSSKKFWQSGFVATFLAGGYVAFLTISPFFYQLQVGLSVTAFAYHQAAIISSFSLFNYLASRIATTLGEKRSVLGGLIITLLAYCTLLLFIKSSYSLHGWLITLFICLASATSAIGYTVTFSKALALFPDKNGPASSFILSTRTLACALFAQLSAWLYNSTLFPAAFLLILCASSALLLARGFYTETK